MSQTKAELIKGFGINSSAPEGSVNLDSSGRLLVGTSSARSNYFGAASGEACQLQVEGNDYKTSGVSFTSTNNSIAGWGPHIALGRSRGGSIGTNGLVSNGDGTGTIVFHGNDGSSFIQSARIDAFVDGTPGANDMPGRIVFSTTADGASSPTERMRINEKGALKATTNSGTYVSATNIFHELIGNHTGETTVILRNMNGSYDRPVVEIDCVRAANSAYSFIRAYSSGFADTEFLLRGDGNAFADGSWSGGGADYAEYFEWSDSNPDAEDRRGISVVLDGDKIREAQPGEDPIGVVSGNPSVVGDAAWNKWSGKYLRDEFGTYIQEDYETIDDDGNTVIQQRRKLNPAYDPDVEYVSREQRPEWDCVGLMGKLRIRKGQVTGSRWIKMRDISDSVEEWLVR